MKKTRPRVIKLESAGKYLRLLGGPPQTKGLRSGLVNLKPQEEIGEHSTEGREEVLVILSGEAIIYCDKYPALNVRAGSLVYIPPQTKHNVRNSGSEVLKYVYIVSPLILLS